ncbi:hypothetical protein CYK04_10545 [Rothia dentocariosa]|nr:hypothetical protein CYK04_10545 [Rothia dentocariosa]
MLYHVQDPFYTGDMPERQTSLRHSAVECVRILCACGLDTLRQYTHRTVVNNLYGGISVAWSCLHAA